MHVYAVCCNPTLHYGVASKKAPTLYVYRRVKPARGYAIEKDPLAEASGLRKGKNSTNILTKINLLKINPALACSAPARLLVILRGVNVNVWMEQ